jgi:ferredoxin
MAYSIEVDGASCIGAGMCVGTAPEHFDLRGGESRPVEPVVVEAPDDLLDAADSCPVQAFTVRDGRGRVVAPEQ